jgi:hypothetical protein
MPLPPNTSTAVGLMPLRLYLLCSSNTFKFVLGKLTKGRDFQLRSKDVYQKATVEDDGGMGVRPVQQIADRCNGEAIQI